MGGLSKLIRLPCAPTRVLYTTAVRGVVGFGPTDWDLAALLTFEARDLETIVREAARRPRPRAELIIPPERLDWFPSDARDLLVENARDGGFSLKGEMYDAGDFFKPPLTHGYMLRAGTTPHLYLYLYTM
ncbi:uncharacterized protein SOCE26_106270 [Sorangium cellulosum]|uniref:Uncharacterized protein n=2 Tax=Sorangium cellulosum TaxID=56 RepID=A0A2L0FC71_SORCE|nr:uncharacterized protein SOCE26_106270 [Sorangium cellulosum]